MKSKFDWHSEPLSLETKINETYKHTQNVRRFFAKHAGTEIHFDRDFMAWMKKNIGKTLGDAVAEYKTRFL